MGKKIVVLCSSPNAEGHTNTAVAWAVEAMRRCGAEVDVIDIARLHSRTNGCTACMACQQSDQFECVIDDEISPLLRQIQDYDMLIFATPVYFFGPNAQLKLVLDRMFSHVKMNLNNGEFTLARPDQALGLIATAGGDLDGGLSLTDQTFRTMTGMTRQDYHSLLISHAPNEMADSESAEQIKQKARDFGKAMAQ